MGRRSKGPTLELMEPIKHVPKRPSVNGCQIFRPPKGRPVLKVVKLRGPTFRFRPDWRMILVNKRIKHQKECSRVCWGVSWLVFRMLQVFTFFFFFSTGLQQHLAIKYNKQLHDNAVHGEDNFWRRTGDVTKTHLIMVIRLTGWTCCHTSILPKQLSCPMEKNKSEVLK